MKFRRSPATSPRQSMKSEIRRGLCQLLWGRGWAYPPNVSVGTTGINGAVEDMGAPQIDATMHDN